MSVITLTIPTRTAILADCIASVQAQTRLPDEHIILCDHKAEGQVAMRNRALEMTQTEWFATLDDDDQFLPNHIESLMNHAEETGADLVYPGYEMLHGGPDPLAMFGHPFDSLELRRANYIPITHLARTEVVRSVGGFPRCPSEWYFEGDADWGLLIRLLDAEARIVHLPEKTWLWNARHGTTQGLPWSAA